MPEHEWFEVPNLDCMSIDPNDLDHVGSVFKLLWKYSRTKADAMRYRMAGNIPDAMEFESRCEVIYRKLPQWARW